MFKKLLYFSIFLLSFSVLGQVNKLKEINDNGTSSSRPTNLIVVDGKLYFSADDSNGANTPGGADLGKELWASDGTEAGTIFVKDIKTGSGSSNPFNFFNFNNTLYFTGNDGNAELWTSDGTEAGTTKIDLLGHDGDSPNRALVVGSKVYFTGIPAAGQVNRLIEWDGTTANIVANVDTNNGFENILSTMIALNNKILLYANYSTDDATTGNELYEYNPNTDLFSLVKNITGDDGNSGISNFTKIGTTVYFEATGKLWETDGTNAGTISVSAAAAINSTSNYFAWNDKIFFEGDAGAGDQLYVYDPSSSSVTDLSALSGGVNQDHDPSDYAPYGGYLYYRGEDNADKSGHVWRTNGTTTEQIDSTIKDIDEITVFNNKLYFEGDNGTTGDELYVLDPSTLSINKVTLNNISIYPNPSKNKVYISHNLSDEITFSISDINGKQLIKGNLTDNTIQHNLNSGMYLLTLITNSASKTQKIIVE